MTENIVSPNLDIEAIQESPLKSDNNKEEIIASPEEAIITKPEEAKEEEKEVKPEEIVAKEVKPEEKIEEKPEEKPEEISKNYSWKDYNIADEESELGNIFADLKISPEQGNALFQKFKQSEDIALDEKIKSLKSNLIEKVGLEDSRFYYNTLLEKAGGSELNLIKTPQYALDSLIQSIPVVDSIAYRVEQTSNLESVEKDIVKQSKLLASTEAGGEQSKSLRAKLDKLFKQRERISSNAR